MKIREIHKKWISYHANIRKKRHVINVKHRLNGMDRQMKLQSNKFVLHYGMMTVVCTHITYRWIIVWNKVDVHNLKQVWCNLRCASCRVKIQEAVWI